MRRSQAIVSTLSRQCLNSSRSQCRYLIEPICNSNINTRPGQAASRIRYFHGSSQAHSKTSQALSEEDAEEDEEITSQYTSDPHSTSYSESSTDHTTRTEYAKAMNSRKLPSSSSISSIESVLPFSELYDLSFARSSGPGGQNVNKLNTKAVLRFYLGKAGTVGRGNNEDGGTSSSPLPLPVPKAVTSWIANQSQYYTAATHSLLLTNSSARSQAENKRLVVAKLFDHLSSVINQDIRGETSQDKLDRIESNKRKFNAQVKKSKMAGKAKMARRRGSDM
ncbi:unnamed protein product [Sympodiomycopsis kandeliae]